MLNRTSIAALSAAAFVMALGMSQPASAQDVTMWRPLTPAGGAQAEPGYYDSRAAVRVSGIGSAAAIHIAPTVSNSVYNDYSTPVTNVTGGQTNVNASGQLTNGGTFTVNTGRDTTFSGDSQQNNTTTNASTTATLGSGSSVTTNTSSNNNDSGPPH